jgi:hypothetical protein
MSAYEYKTDFVTEQGSVQQAAAITKIMVGGWGEEEGIPMSTVFTVTPGRGSNPTQQMSFKR